MHVTRSDLLGAAVLTTASVTGGLVLAAVVVYLGLSLGLVDVNAPV